MKKCLLIILISGLCSLMTQAQNVGVSNATGLTPQSLLHVHNTATGRLLQLTNANTGNTATDGFQISIDGSSNIVFNQYEAAKMSFYTSNAERITILPGGNVGIGTATPTTRLHIEGSGTYDAVLRLNNTGTTGANAFLVASNSSWTFGPNKLGIGIGGDPSSTYVKMTIQSDGNVGIGNTSPAQKLDVDGVVNAATGYRIANAAATGGNYLRGNGTNFVASGIQAADVPVLNQNTTGTAAGFTGSLSGDVTGTQNATVIADNAVDGSDIQLGSDATGDIMYYNGTDWARLAAGTTGKFLKANGAAAPSWADDNNTTYTAGTGISISTNTINNTGVLSLTAGTGISISGSSGNVTITNNVSIPANNVTGTGAATHVSYWSGANTQTYDSDGNFFWDPTNNRLGIGATSPAYSLDVNGNAGFNAIHKIGPLSNNPENGMWNVLWTAISAGLPLYNDEEFVYGTNSVNVYNNSGGTGVQHFWESGDGSQPNTSGKWIRIENNGSATSPGYGGFYQTINSRRNATFVQRFRAKLPVGYNLVIAENSQGTNATSYWLTPTAGTGKWEEYIRVSHCGNTGTFASGGHVYVSGGSSAVFTWYLAS